VNITEKLDHFYLLFTKPFELETIKSFHFLFREELIKAEKELNGISNLSGNREVSNAYHELTNRFAEIMPYLIYEIRHIAQIESIISLFAWGGINPRKNYYNLEAELFDRREINIQRQIDNEGHKLTKNLLFSALIDVVLIRFGFVQARKIFERYQGYINTERFFNNSVNYLKLNDNKDNPIQIDLNDLDYLISMYYNIFSSNEYTYQSLKIRWDFLVNEFKKPLKNLFDFGSKRSINQDILLLDLVMSRADYFSKHPPNHLMPSNKNPHRFADIESMTEKILFIKEFLQIANALKKDFSIYDNGKYLIYHSTSLLLALEDCIKFDTNRAPFVDQNDHFYSFKDIQDDNLAFLIKKVSDLEDNRVALQLAITEETPLKEKQSLLLKFLEIGLRENHLDNNFDLLSNLMRQVQNHPKVFESIISGEQPFTRILKLANTEILKGGDYTPLLVCQIKSVETYLKIFILDFFRKNQDNMNFYIYPRKRKDVPNEQLFFNKDSFKFTEYVNGLNLGDLNYLMHNILKNNIMKNALRPHPIPNFKLYFKPDPTKRFTLAYWIKHIRNGKLHTDSISNFEQANWIRNETARLLVFLLLVLRP
jgi:hypothetical protein